MNPAVVDSRMLSSLVKVSWYLPGRYLPLVGGWGTPSMSVTCRQLIEEGPLRMLRPLSDRTVLPLPGAVPLSPVVVRTLHGVGGWVVGAGGEIVNNHDEGRASI